MIVVILICTAKDVFVVFPGPVTLSCTFILAIQCYRYADVVCHVQKGRAELRHLFDILCCRLFPYSGLS